MSHIKELIPPPTLTVVVCKNDIQTIEDPSCENPKKSKLFDIYVGDICPALKTAKSQYIKIQNGYYFERVKKIDKEWKWLPFYENPNSIATPQMLFIKPPIKESIDCNYLTNLIPHYKSLTQTLFGINNNTDKTQNKNVLTNDITHLIFTYLPFTFPIFISCASLYRGRGDFTHWTYPYTKSKKWILNYLRECENTFDNNTDCYYISEWYTIKDDCPVDFNNKSEWIDRHANILINYQRNDKLERKWNEPILIAQKQSNKLNEVINRRNAVGGSYWLTMCWSKDDKNVEWFTENSYSKSNSSVKKVHSRIGGSSGIKSRCYYQTLSGLQGKYLPMSVLNVCCNWKMFNRIMQS